MFASSIWIAPAALSAVNQIAQSRIHGEPPPGAQQLLFAAGDWLIYAFLTPVIFWIADRWPIVRPAVARRIALHLGISLLFCAAWALIGTALRLALGRIFAPQEVAAYIAKAGDRLWLMIAQETLSWIFTTLPFGVIVYLTVVGLAHAVRYFTEAAEREVQMARLSEQLSSARFAALEAQVNPHFLFNTLNTIAVRARDGDREGTTRIVELLSDVLRRTLTRHRASEVTVDEELELVRDYLAIEQARFSDRLHQEFAIDERVHHAAVPTFSLQHLVENAIRHGIARRTGAGLVRIAARRDTEWLVLTVEDDGAGVSAGQSFAAGHGIENTRERLRALYGDRASLDVTTRADGGTIATLRVPFRELPLESDVAER
jgi:two-component system LytT family sensor kinase